MSKSLFEQMYDNGLLEESSMQIIVANLARSTAPTIIGDTTADDIGTEEPMVVLLVLDKSGSMYRQREQVKDGLHKIKDIAERNYERYGVETILGVLAFGERGRIQKLIPFTPVDQINPDWIDRYDPNDDETALVEGVMEGVIGTAGMGYDLFREGVAGGKRLMITLTDGGENSYPWGPAGEREMYEDCAKIATVMSDLRRPKQNIFGFIGVGDESYYYHIATQMGFKPKNIVNVEKGAWSIAEAMDIVSQSIDLHSVAMSTGQEVDDEDGDVLVPTNIVTDADAEDDLFS